MIGKEDVALVRNQVEKGRGLWLGLFLDHSQMEGHAFRSALPEDAHVTLLHLGKRFPVGAVDELCRALDRMPSWGWDFDMSPMPAQITGFGELWRANGRHTKILLVNSAQVCALRSKLLNELYEQGLGTDDVYGFIPHVTLDQATQARSPVREQMITFKTVHLVCGEAKVALS